MKDRVPRLNQLLKREVGKIILRDIDLPDNVLATITEVETSPNLIQAKIYISALPDEKLDEVMVILNSQVYFIQKEINDKLRIRPVPKIIFKKEDKTRTAAKVEELLAEINYGETNLENKPKI